MNQTEQNKLWQRLAAIEQRLDSLEDTRRAEKNPVRSAFDAVSANTKQDIKAA